MDREIFAERRARATSNWYEEAKKREGNIEAYIARRHAVHLERWKQASRFIKAGDSVLDVGGGNLYPLLLEYLRLKALDYFYVDVDPNAVNGSRAVAEKYGFKGNQFAVGFNDQFKFPDEKFDAVFSSHCIDQSFNLDKTLQELNRIIKEGGHLLMAVSFGWEENPAQPYFLSPNQWVALVEDAGFEVRMAQVDRDYQELGCDFFVSAKKMGVCRDQARIDATNYRKDAYQFLPFSDPAIAYHGNFTLTDRGDAACLRGTEWKVTIDIPNAGEIVPVFTSHDWSGIVEIRSGDASSVHDLFSWHSSVQPVRHTIQKRLGEGVAIAIRPAGRNSASWSDEAVLHGVMYR